MHEATMSLVLLEGSGPIAKLILNHPENLNAMTEAMGEAIEKQVEEINARPEFRVVVITGAGRAFSAGGDLDFILDRTTKSWEVNQKEMVGFYSRFLSLRNIKVPTIAMIQGHAIGAGFLIALACDLRYGSDAAKMAVNFARLGLSSGMGGLYSLARLAGAAHTADLLFTGRTIDGPTALKMGLLNELLPLDQLETRVLEIAEQIAQNAPLALRIMKRGLQATAYSNLDAVMQFESEGQAETFATEDLKEGIQAIREKRRPKFQDK